VAHGAQDVGLIQGSVLKKPSIAIRTHFGRESETLPLNELALFGQISSLVKFWHDHLNVAFGTFGGKASFGSR
jgi:hypothetical protein